MAEPEQNLNEFVKSPKIMIVDAPTEEPAKEENEDNEKNAAMEAKNDASPTEKHQPSVSVKSSPLSAPQSKFVTRSILKPPQLSVNNAAGNSSTKPFILNPSRLNPFAKNSAEDAGSSDEKKSSQVNGETPKFVPLICDSKSSSNNQTNVKVNTNPRSSSSFVFGQNLLDRVVASESKPDEPKPSTSINSNGTTELLFSNAIKNEVKADSSSNSQSKETKSLSESAREYEESRANKRKYEEVEVKTGEEGETNILNISCKLFAFDKASGSWQERGRGVLRLNDLEDDKNCTQSRLVFRTTGSLRVVLNTKIWAEMTVEQASEKSTRFTAQDSNGEIKVFLVMAGIEDSKQLCYQIRTRVQKEISSQKNKKLAISSDSEGN